MLQERAGISTSTMCNDCMWLERSVLLVQISWWIQTGNGQLWVAYLIVATTINKSKHPLIFIAWFFHCFDQVIPLTFNVCQYFSQPLHSSSSHLVYSISSSSVMSSLITQMQPVASYNTCLFYLICNFYFKSQQCVAIEELAFRRVILQNLLQLQYIFLHVYIIVPFYPQGICSKNSGRCLKL